MLENIEVQATQFLRMAWIFAQRKSHNFALSSISRFWFRKHPRMNKSMPLFSVSDFVGMTRRAK